MRTLFLIDSIDNAGPDRVFLTLLQHLDRTRVEPILAVGDAPNRLLGSVPDDVAVHHLPSASRYPIRALRSLVRDTAPDVILSTLRMNVTAMAARPFLGRDTRVIIRITNHMSADLSDLARDHRGRAFALRGAFRLLLPRVDCVLCQSSEMARDVRSTIPRLRGELPVIHNPVDGPELRRRSREEVDDLPPAGKPTFVAMGRLARQKGFDVLLDALPPVLRDAPDAQLWILGDGPDRAALAVKARDPRLAGQVHLVGFVDNPLPVLRRADVFVSSSRWEGFSNSIAQAHALGLPIVATTGAGVGDEVIEEPTSGWLAAPGSVESLTAALRRAVESYTSVDAAGVEAECDRRFAPSVIADRYASLIEQVHEAPR